MGYTVMYILHWMPKNEKFNIDVPFMQMENKSIWSEYMISTPVRVRYGLIAYVIGKDVFHFLQERTIKGVLFVSKKKRKENPPAVCNHLSHEAASLLHQHPKSGSSGLSSFTGCLSGLLDGKHPGMVRLTGQHRNPSCHQTQVEIGFVLDSNTFQHLTKLAWCTGTNTIIPKV